jgi:hypothetical protein
VLFDMVVFSESNPLPYDMAWLQCPILLLNHREYGVSMQVSPTKDVNSSYKIQVIQNIYLLFFL